MSISSNDPISVLIDTGAMQLAAVSDSAKLDCRILISHVLDKPLSYLLTWPEKMLSQAQFNQFEQLLAQRLLGKPIAYLIGYKEFWSLKLNVSPATLIPRPETELLVETVLTHHQQTSLSCLDLGTGTGAIALALASEQEHWQMEAVDFQKEAVALAKHNAQHLSLTQVNIYQSDWFEQVDKNNRFDVIVSNPPYIDEDDLHLNQGDVKFEPKSALVADKAGYADIEHIIQQSKSFLTNNGYLYFEHGFNQGKEVRRLFDENAFNDINTVKDYNDNDRITYARYNT